MMELYNKCMAIISIKEINRKIEENINLGDNTGNLLEKGSDETEDFSRVMERINQLEGLNAVLDYHKNPEKFINPEVKLYGLKKLGLRLLRLYTTVQVSFNEYVVTYLKDLFGVNKELLKIIKSLEGNRQSGSYKSKYFEQVEDKFYIYQQDLFRGRYLEVLEKQRIYSEDVEKAKKLFSKYEFVDVGFGRGEFLEILRKMGVKKVVGVDINKILVDAAKKKGFNTCQQSAVKFLEEYRGKLGGVFAFQVIEHMEFQEIFDFVFLAYKKLAKGGVMIIEVPNFRNIMVSSTGYYLDHTHKSKVPPSFLEMIFKFVGFKKIKTRFLSPARELDKLNEVEKMMFGYQDFAIIAYK
jgi:2-polyprenyl-3-methyl-5-hydroxy-6-metoxy-1,4-benzoquinol methylase